MNLHLAALAPMLLDTPIYLAGHQGMVGAALYNHLRADGYSNIITRIHAELDLIDQQAVNYFFEQEKPACVILAAAKVGGIGANHHHPAEFIYQNLMMEANVIHAAWQNKVQRLLFLGSSCIYPRLAQQPIVEGALLSGPLEPTNESYAIAKIAGIKLCESYNHQYGTDFRSVMPTNLYGQNDNFNLTGSHVIPALMRKFHEGKLAKTRSVTVWGSGTPRREFLHVNDMAAASVHVMQWSPEAYKANTQPKQSHINVGFGTDVTIKALAEIIRSVVGYTGDIMFDINQPDGTPRKLMDSSRLFALGWRPGLDLRQGLQMTYNWYVEHVLDLRK